MQKDLEQEGTISDQRLLKMLKRILHETNTHKLVLSHFADSMNRVVLFQKEFGYVDILHCYETLADNNLVLSTEENEVVSFYSDLELCYSYDLNSASIKKDLNQFFNSQYVVYIAGNDQKKTEMIKFAEFTQQEFLDVNDLLYLTESSDPDFLIDYIVNHLKLKKSKQIALYINTNTFKHNWKFLLQTLHLYIKLIMSEIDTKSFKDKVNKCPIIQLNPSFDNIKTIFQNHFHLKMVVYDQIIDEQAIKILTSEGFLYLNCRNIQDKIKQNILNQGVDPCNKSKI